MRKIIQICTYAQPSSKDWNGFCNLTALCDDGTVWEIDNPQSKDSKWSRLPDIPQDNEQEGV